MAVPRVKLKEVCSQDRQTVKAGEHNDLKYIGLETIEANSGLFIGGELSKTPEIPKANSFRFGRQHVLYGKLRPYLNKVALPDFEGKCSTEIIPLLPKAVINRAYLAYFLRSSQIVSQITAKTAGSRMPRADMDFVLNLELPLPPIDEQHRIVDILSRAEGIVRLRREAQKKAEEIIPALFLDMFGDPATNPKGWNRHALGELVNSIDSGQSPKCIDRAKQPDEWGVLRLSSLLNSKYNEEEHKTLPPDITPNRKVEVRVGDILISRKNTYELVGTCTYVESTAGQMLLPDLIFRLNISNRNFLNPIYLWGLLTSSVKREQIRTLASGSAGSMPNISKQRLKTLQIETPPIEIQNRFSSSVELIRSIESQQAAAMEKAVSTFDALLEQTFKETIV